MLHVALLPLSIIHQRFNYTSHRQFSCVIDLLSAAAERFTQHDTAVTVSEAAGCLRSRAFCFCHALRSSSGRRWDVPLSNGKTPIYSRRTRENNKSFKSHFVFCVPLCCVVSCLFHFCLIRLILIAVFLSPPPSIPPPPPLFLSKGTFFQKSTEPREKSDMGVPCKFPFYVLTPSSFFPASLLIHRFLLWCRGIGSLFYGSAFTILFLCRSLTFVSWCLFSDSEILLPRQIKFNQKSKIKSN